MSDQVAVLSLLFKYLAAALQKSGNLSPEVTDKTG